MPMDDWFPAAVPAQSAPCKHVWETRHETWLCGAGTMNEEYEVCAKCGTIQDETVPAQSAPTPETCVNCGAEKKYHFGKREQCPVDDGIYSHRDVFEPPIPPTSAPWSEGGYEAPKTERHWETERAGLYQLIAELKRQLTCSGMVELAVINPNVSSYIDHWEGRATKAESEVEELKRQLAEAKGESSWKAVSKIGMRETG